MPNAIPFAIRAFFNGLLSQQTIQNTMRRGITQLEFSSHFCHTQTIRLACCDQP